MQTNISFLEKLAADNNASVNYDLEKKAICFSFGKPITENAYEDWSNTEEWILDAQEVMEKMMDIGAEGPLMQDIFTNQSNEHLYFEDVEIKFEWHFLRPADSKREDILAIPIRKIQQMSISNTYDSNGQSITPEDAGNWIRLLSQKAIDLANKAYYEYHDDDEWEEMPILDRKYAPGNDALDVSFYDFGYVADAIVGSDLVEGMDYETNYPQCEGFNYWDGNNWKTVLISCETWDGDYPTLLDDIDEILDLHIAIAQMQYHSRGIRYKHFVADGFKITESLWLNDWETYSIKRVRNN